MTDPITGDVEYDAFVRAWHADGLADNEVMIREARERDLIDEDGTRML